ncbi:MAG: hypothetical protein R3242_07145 [Akkermansiaceae bacterium]|nr:hypothetical protein [Akkermansiaceae bacterium]
MKLQASISALGLFLLTGVGIHAAEQAPSAVMQFLNEDHISGQLMALDDESVLWDSEVLAEPATIGLENVLNMTLNAENQAPDSSHVAVLQLANGDEVLGQLKDITDESIVLETWFGGIIEFNRVMVSKIQIMGGQSFSYRGPTSLDGWRQTPKDSWDYRRQSFISLKSGSIAHDKILPDQCTIKFTVQRKADSLDLKLMLFSDDITSSRPRSGYELAFQRTSVYLRSSKNRNFIGSAHSQELAQNDTANIEVRASRKLGMVALLINGELIEVWSEPNMDDNNFGSGLHFIAGDDGPVRISSISVGLWDGKNSEELQPGRRHFRHNPEPVAPPKKEEEQKGRMQLANGDSLTGKVLSIDEGLIQLDTPLGEIKLPVQRLRSLNLDGLDEQEAKKENGDIRAFFADGSTLVFRLDKVDGNRVTGVSQHFSTDSKFGEAIFDLSAISRIEFRPHEERLESLRKDKIW